MTTPAIYSCQVADGTGSTSDEDKVMQPARPAPDDPYIPPRHSSKSYTPQKTRRDSNNDEGNAIAPVDLHGTVDPAIQHNFDAVFGVQFQHRGINNTDNTELTTNDDDTNCETTTDNNDTNISTVFDTTLDFVPAPPFPIKKKGRPTGSKNRTKMMERATPVIATIDGKGEGKHFSGREGLYLSKAWINQSMKGTNQSDASMWDGISEYCETKFSLKRQPAALKAKWCSLRKGVNIYLAAKEHIMKGNNSGRTDEELMEMTMTYYKFKAGRTMPNGERKDSAEFKYMEAATFLSDYPKFGGISEEEEDKAIKGAMQPEINSSSKEDEGKYKRPKGVKAMRREVFKKKGIEKKENERKLKQKNIQETNKIMNRLAISQERDRRAERNFRLMQMLPKESDRFKELFKLMLDEVDTEKDVMEEIEEDQEEE